MNSKMLKPAILSVSVLTIMASAAVAPALGKIRLAFPDANATLIKLVLTLPPLIIIPFSLLSGWLVYRIPKKTLMIIGLLIYLIAGCGGGFARSITELLIIRAILGIGVGLIMPLSTTLVGDFFQGPARNKMMGQATSLQNLGGVIFQITAGYLAVISWRYAFGVYSLALLILLMIIFWLPEPPRAAAQQTQKSKTRLPIGVYLCAFLCILNMVVFFSVPTNLAILLETEKRLFSSSTPLFKDKQDLQFFLESGKISESTKVAFEDNNIKLSDQARIEVAEPTKAWNIIDGGRKYVVKKENGELVIATGKLGKAAVAGYILSVLSLAAMISGLILSQILAFLRRYAIPLTIALMGLGFWLLGHANNVVMIFIAVAIVGFCFGIIQPFLFVFVQKIAPQDSRALAMAIVGSSIFLGQFLSPIVLEGISAIAKQDSIFFKYNFCGVTLGIAGLLGLALTLRPQKVKQETS